MHYSYDVTAVHPYPPEPVGQFLCLGDTVVSRASLQQVDIHDGRSAHHHLQLLPVEQRQQTRRHDRGETVANGGALRVDLVQSAGGETKGERWRAERRA